jgi:hypothetical protein
MRRSCGPEEQKAGGENHQPPCEALHDGRQHRLLLLGLGGEVGDVRVGDDAHVAIAPLLGPEVGAHKLPGDNTLQLLPTTRIRTIWRFGTTTASYRGLSARSGTASSCSPGIWR